MTRVFKMDQSSSEKYFRRTTASTRRTNNGTSVISIYNSLILSVLLLTCPLLPTSTFASSAALALFNSESIASSASSLGITKKEPEDSSTTVIAVAGRTAILPACGPGNSLLLHGPTGKSNRVIKWTRDNSRLPSSHRHKILPNGTLVISDSHKSDTGSYMCSMKDAKGSLERRVTRLRVIESPRIIPFEFPPDVMVNTRTKVMCSISQGEPPLTFNWLKDGQSLDDRKSSGESSGQTASSSSSQTLASSNFGLTFHPSSSSSSSSSPSPSSSSSSSSSPSASSSSLSNVDSMSSKLTHNRLLPLHSSGTLQTSNGIRIEFNGDYSILSIANVQVSHAGNYTCTVSNEASTASYSSILSVNEPPQWTSEPSDASTILGNEITMDCSATGNPKPAISWKKASGDPWDLSPIYNGPHYTLLPNGSLKVHEVTREVDGHYFCSASNGFGSDVGKLIRLTVNEPAHFVTRMKSQSINKKDSAELECTAVGDGPITISWFKQELGLITGGTGDGTGAKKGDERFLMHKSEEKGSKLTTSKLVIRSTERTDGGLYSCNATNKWGADTSLIQLIIKEIPDKPSSLQVVNVTGTTVTLVWIEPFNGNGVITKYMVKLTDPITNDTLNEVTSLGANTTVTGLKPNSGYKCQVYAQNEVGWSLASDAVYFRTEEDAPSGPPLSVTAIATGPNSIKITWKAPLEDLWNGQISGFYVGYFPSGSSQEQYKVIETSKKGQNLNQQLQQQQQQQQQQQLHQSQQVKEQASSETTSKQALQEGGGGGSGSSSFTSSGGSGDRYEAHLTNLQRSTRYIAYVRAYNSKGKGPPSDQVTVKTLDDVPPTAPALAIYSTTASSITISWNYMNSLQSTSNSVSQFVLYFKKLHSPLMDWIEKPISTKDTSYTISGLDCGTSYEFYMTAHNSVGKSEPSPPVIGRTLGTSPISPKSSDLFAKISSTESVINLSTWKTNECPISEFTVRIRTKSENLKSDWIVLTSKHGNIASLTSPSSSSSQTNLPSSSPSASSSLVLPSASISSASSSIALASGAFSSSENFFFIRNLLPQTMYEVEITARNQAGTTQAQYEFYTKSLEGVFKLKPSTTDSISKFDTSHISHSNLITPLAVSLMVLLIIVLTGWLVCSKESVYTSRATARNSVNGDFIPNGDGKVPFQAVSLKDLSSSNDHHMGHSLGGHLTTGVPGGCHTLHATSGGVIGTVDLETVNSSPGNSSSCLRASNYSRPYDIFPVNVAIDATLRRTGTSIGVSGVTGHEHQSFQKRSLYESLVPSSEM